MIALADLRGVLLSFRHILSESFISTYLQGQRRPPQREILDTPLQKSSISENHMLKDHSLVGVKCSHLLGGVHSRERTRGVGCGKNHRVVYLKWVDVYL